MIDYAQIHKHWRLLAPLGGPNHTGAWLTIDTGDGYWITRDNDTNRVRLTLAEARRLYEELDKHFNDKAGEPTQ